MFMLLKYIGKAHQLQLFGQRLAPAHPAQPVAGPRWVDVRPFARLTPTAGVVQVKAHRRHVEGGHFEPTVPPPKVAPPPDPTAAWRHVGVDSERRAVMPATILARALWPDQFEADPELRGLLPDGARPDPTTGRMVYRDRDGTTYPIRPANPAALVHVDDKGVVSDDEGGWMADRFGPKLGVRQRAAVVEALAERARQLLRTKDVKTTQARLVNLRIATTCPRCLGSGHYSRNAAGQTHCYQCDGRGTIVPEKLSEWAEVLPRAEEAAANGMVDRYLEARQNTRSYDRWAAGFHAKWTAGLNQFFGDKHPSGYPKFHPGADPIPAWDEAAAASMAEVVAEASHRVWEAAERATKAREAVFQATRPGRAGADRAEEAFKAQRELAAAQAAADAAAEGLPRGLQALKDGDGRAWALMLDPEVRKRARATEEQQRVRQRQIQHLLQHPHLDGGEEEARVRDLARRALQPGPGHWEARQAWEWATAWPTGTLLPRPPPGPTRDRLDAAGVVNLSSNKWDKDKAHALREWAGTPTAGG